MCDIIVQPFNNEEWIRRGCILQPVRGIKPNLRYYLYIVLLVSFCSRFIFTADDTRIASAPLQLLDAQTMRKTISFDFNITAKKFHTKINIQRVLLLNANLFRNLQSTLQNLSRTSPQNTSNSLHNYHERYRRTSRTKSALESYTETVQLTLR